MSVARFAFQACSFNHSDISCAHELHAFGGEPSDPQPHPNSIEVSYEAILSGGAAQVAGAREDGTEVTT